MKPAVGMIVTDASPLITLAAADALNLLLMPGIPITVPDMVHFEVTRYIAKLGAKSVVRWIRDNPSLVRLEATEVFSEYQALLTLDPATKSRGRGEAAANEILEDCMASDPDLVAILLFEDSDISRRKFASLLPERVMPLTTSAYLHELEACGRIQSADQILDQAMSKGRDVSRQKTTETSPELARALRGSVA